MENGAVSGPMLPDPTADLHWSDFRGPIQDIFASNAVEHPDRLCVVETASNTTPQRNFTYRQIHEASNTLAHHFIEHGIQRGEVIMIYAYRSVELVISIMGVLKAGATFSVIDPAYPSDRQIVYLDVARPRGLIMIEKASREEGELSQQVREWVQGNLDLRAEIPALELLDDGTLRGGASSDGKDVFSPEQRQLKSKHPGIVVGPDSVPTLSFTSGSEGRPKGVRGRHFSLTYYVPFMAQRFNLSENDRFTMLSGIAHDPIQRDIFTPLALGAKLLVPAKTVIQHQMLAEWMRTYKPTVTHLTPAMGQILVGGATAEFPSLHHAFFVGDVLIKRDCRLLQALASNVRIVNMYGTTETQRAVSYFEIPSRYEDPGYLENMNDTIPAGRGMQDVQLLVVDRESLEKGAPQLCRVNDVGEIYVRAGGLAEGYLGSDKLSRQKFVPNFFLDPNVWVEAEGNEFDKSRQREPWRAFWKGPRDRLYRSGDLGYYTGSGDVQCSGRDDDQAKIRGFRIELGEIDTHISHHPNVRENVTLVRRDKDEEPTLVSYIVPATKALQETASPDGREDDTMTGMLKRFKSLRDDVRENLRKKLPPYAVPSVIIPLQKFPLTPNYKIDRKVLPYPDAAILATAVTAGKAAREFFTENEKAVGSIWAQRLGISADAIDLDDNFQDLGAHSIRAQQIVFDVNRSRGLALPVKTLLQNPTIRGFASVIDRASTHIVNGENTEGTPPEADYALDGEHLATSLPTSYPSGTVQSETILVTGATGFLGSSILEKILDRKSAIKVIAIVRAKTTNDALPRIKTTCIAYGKWSDIWELRIECLTGDLSRERFGLALDVWDRLAKTVDVIIHNGAIVHWIKGYHELKATNVLSTLAAINLCSTGKPKHLTFISSTAVLDTPHYAANDPVFESDTLFHSRTGLSTGYGQTKYISESLIRTAGAHGLRGSIIRPGYITGDPSTGIGPTDDFLLRILKGSIQLCCRPDLNPNTINLVPVSYCARIVVAASLKPPLEQAIGVVHVTPHPQLPFNDFLSALETYGYEVPQVPYANWKAALQSYVGSDENEKEPHALLPLFDWVTGDLPSETNSRALDDTNAEGVLRADGAGKEWAEHSIVGVETVGRYLGFMASIGFVPWPKEKGRLEGVQMGEGRREALKMVGRGGSREIAPS